MNILHIGHITDDSANGVSVTVPKHLLYQSSYANVTLLNIVPFVPECAQGNYEVEINKDRQTLLRLLKDKKWDLVIFHEIYRPFYIKAYRLAIRQGVPYIIIPHGSLTVNAQRVSWHKKKIANILLMNNFVRRSLALQFMSDTEKEKSVMLSHNSIVQGSGIELQEQKKTEFATEGLKIIYIGRLDIEVKGLDVIIKTAIDYQSEFREKKLHLTIAGPDSKGGYDWLKDRISANNIGDIVELEKPVFGENKIRKLLDYDIFVQLSRTEAQCLGLMEAMELGLACIVSPGSTFYEIAEKYKLAAPCLGNSNSLFRILTMLEKNPALIKSYSSLCSKYIADNYDWEKVGKKMIENYKQYLGKV